MPGVLPEGEPVPVDGSLPDAARAAVGARGFGVYVHVPFCASRCGYCDFNTYTPGELGGSTDQDGYVDQVLAELALAGRVLGDRPPARVDTVFVGGGTPTLLPADDLARILDGIDRLWGLAGDVEVTTEANPESVTRESLKELRAAGYNRISLGMQSTAAGVLAILDRRHTAGRALQAVGEAREVGFDHVNLDLIYGTPGETADDFAGSLAAVIDAGVDHVSAYALIVEDGTRLAARMRRGELPYPDDDVAADRYLAAEQALSGAGFSWYEVSNWARTPAARCRHNLLYWAGGDWWGLGPGAHSHVGGVRWWNVKHPATYAARLGAGTSPGQARELLSAVEQRVEDVMLRLRLSAGLPLTVLDDPGRAGADRARDAGLLDGAAYDSGQAVLTLRGRLLADAVVRDLLP
ncbi:radical SAM family heme chaperone HemW [Plantactinospora soyae]|uniref:Heme chaperone HemW n=1 Tax=Plantactinospora soyae TaxID=1544732 RepID=A0A927MDR4_9ACTN|nr:radical SAM family heme chaperone HemW [Plantactinospora soyae]MBE1492858.1 oxygen-independent coproporphyrinogen-3 oxidase [Plantactinospora soyae]